MEQQEQIDDAVRRAAPPPLGADGALRAEARQVGRAVAAFRRPPGPWHGVFAASVLAAGLLGVGVTGAVAGPAMIDWVGWVPDAAVQRTFTIAQGTPLGPCEVVARVVQEGGVAEDVAAARAESARRFLARHDWDALTASITAEDIADELAAEEARRGKVTSDGTQPPAASPGLAASQLMGELLREEFVDAGHLQPGVSLEMSGRCGTPAEGAGR